MLIALCIATLARRIVQQVAEVGTEVELSLNGISFQLQHPQTVEYKGIIEAQLLTYMKLAGIETGLLINFNVTKLKKGIKRYVL